jgi:hypothetical protein
MKKTAILFLSLIIAFLGQSALGQNFTQSVGENNGNLFVSIVNTTNSKTDGTQLPVVVAMAFPGVPATSPYCLTFNHGSTVILEDGDGIYGGASISGQGSSIWPSQTFVYPYDPILNGTQVKIQTLIEDPTNTWTHTNCSTHTLGNTVNLPMWTARRTSGVAPFLVHFSAIGDHTGVAQLPNIGSTFDPLTAHYEWDYGDSYASGNWAYSGKAKDESIGFIGSHVYENAGTYYATLKVTRSDGVLYIYQQTITVTDPDTVFSGSTYYVSLANGSNSYNGTSPSTPFKDISYAMNILWGSNGPRRLLIRNGETYPTTGLATYNSYSGPFLISGYNDGSEVPPLIQCTTSNDCLYFEDISDLRIVDVNIDGPSSSPGNGFVPGEDCLILRSEITDFYHGLMFHGSTGNHAGCGAVECNIHDCTTYGLYYAAPGGRLSVLGSYFDDSGSNSLFRVYCHESVVMHNKFEDGGQNPVRLMGRLTSSPDRSEYIVFADNVLVSGNDWLLEVGPESNNNAQYIYNVLIEGNKFTQTGGYASALIWGQKISLRNNIFNTSGAQPIIVEQRGGSGSCPVPEKVTIYNNTAYRNTSSDLTLVSCNASDSTLVKNNIVYCSNGVETVATGTYTASNNLTTDPTFTNAGSGDFSIQSTSAAKDAGTALTVRRDFVRAARPFNSLWDIGAYERQ